MMASELLAVLRALQEKHRRRGLYPLSLRSLDQLCRLEAVQGTCHDERGPFHLFDRVYVVLDHGLRHRLVEAMRGCDDDVKTGVLDREGSGLRQGVQEVEGGVPF